MLVSADLAEARRGGFVSSLIRGGARAAASSGSPGAATAIKSYGPDVLTVAQLESCIKRASDLDRSADALETRSQEIGAESAAIDRAQAELQAQRARVNTSSQASVKAYNARLDGMRKRIANHNAGVEQVKAQQTSHNVDVRGYNADCAKKYYQDDMDSVTQKLGLKDQ